MPMPTEPPAFLALAETISSLIALIQGDKIVYVNPAGRAILGYPPDAIIGRDFWDFVHPDSRAAAQARGRARQQGIPQPKRFLERLATGDGREVWMDYSIDVLLLDGQTTTLVTGHDVTERKRVEDALRESEERFRAAFHSASIGKAISSCDLRILQVNDVMCRTTGYSREELLAMDQPIARLTHPDDLDVGMEGVRAMLAGERQTTRHLKRYLHKQGHTIWGDLTASIVRDAQGAPLYFVIEVEDVTERKRMEDALRSSEERFRAAFDNASIAKAITSPDMRLLQVNASFCRMLGYAREELLAMETPIQRITHPEDHDVGRDEILAMLRGERDSMRILKRYVHKDGRTVWGMLTTTIVRGEKRVPLYFVTEVEDITERKAAEDALRSSEQRFRNLGTQAPVMMVGMDREGRIQSVSNYWLERMGYAHDEVIGRLGADFITLNSHLALLRAFEARQRTNDTAVRNVPLQSIRKDGSLMDVILTAVVEFDDQGEPRGVITVGLDVSELNRADEALRRSEERFRGLFQTSPVMMCTVDAQNRIRDVNDCWTEAFGFTREEAVGRNGFDFLSPDSRRRMEGTQPGEPAPWVASMRNQPVQGVRKDGSLLDLIVTTVPELDERGETCGLICVSMDVTALRENELRYRALVEWAPEAIIVADADSRMFVDANANAEALFGMPREELLAQDVLATSPPMQANGRASPEYAADVIGRAMRGETPVFEWLHYGVGRREIPCRIHLSRLPAAGKNLVRATITDISSEKRMQEELRHQEKMAAMGVLAAGVAHEIGNPLLAMSMATQSLERKSTDPYAQRKLSLIGEHIDRISKIVRQMNDLSRPQSVERTRTCLKRTIERAVEIARFDKRAKDVEVRLDLPEMPFLVAIEDQITQVCLNLALNAFDAMAGNPEQRARVLTVAARIEGERVLVTFEDSGSGIAAEHGARLFQPFFTTKQPGQGTGLGLSVSHRIIRDHGGALTFENRREGGARFRFDLPLEAPHRT